MDSVAKNNHEGLPEVTGILLSWLSGLAGRSAKFKVYDFLETDVIFWESGTLRLVTHPTTMPVLLPFGPKYGRLQLL